eukprot:133660-Ditylum_brightwellii.AAC.1
MTVASRASQVLRGRGIANLKHVSEERVHVNNVSGTGKCQSDHCLKEQQQAFTGSNTMMKKVQCAASNPSLIVSSHFSKLNQSKQQHHLLPLEQAGPKKLSNVHNKNAAKEMATKLARANSTKGSKIMNCDEQSGEVKNQHRI